jgi:hypothetical protein
MLTLKMEAARSSEMFVSNGHTKWRNTPENCKFYLHRRENLGSQTSYFVVYNNLLTENTVTWKLKFNLALLFGTALKPKYVYINI